MGFVWKFCYGFSKGKRQSFHYLLRNLVAFMTIIDFQHIQILTLKSYLLEIDFLVKVEWKIEKNG
jgi:hypothetical protein